MVAHRVRRLGLHDPVPLLLRRLHLLALPRAAFVNTGHTATAVKARASSTELPFADTFHYLGPRDSDCRLSGCKRDSLMDFSKGKL